MMIEHGGINDTMAGWARRVGISRQAMHLRLSAGWPLELALTEQKHPGSRPAVLRRSNWKYKLSNCDTCGV
jgi:hypothetical protein